MLHYMMTATLTDCVLMANVGMKKARQNRNIDKDNVVWHRELLSKRLPKSHSHRHKRVQWINIIRFGIASILIQSFSIRAVSFIDWTMECIGYALSNKFRVSHFECYCIQKSRLLFSLGLLSFVWFVCVLMCAVVSEYYLLFHSYSSHRRRDSVFSHASFYYCNTFEKV